MKNNPIASIIVLCFVLTGCKYEYVKTLDCSNHKGVISRPIVLDTKGKVTFDVRNNVLIKDSLWMDSVVNTLRLCSRKIYVVTQMEHLMADYMGIFYVQSVNFKNYLVSQGIASHKIRATTKFNFEINYSQEVAKSGMILIVK